MWTRLNCKWCNSELQYWSLQKSESLKVLLHFLWLSCSSVWYYEESRYLHDKTGINNYIYGMFLHSEWRPSSITVLWNEFVCVVLLHAPALYSSHVSILNIWTKTKYLRNKKKCNRRLCPDSVCHQRCAVIISSKVLLLVQWWKNTD